MEGSDRRRRERREGEKAGGRESGEKWGTYKKINDYGGIYYRITDEEKRPVIL